MIVLAHKHSSVVQQHVYGIISGDAICLFPYKIFVFNVRISILLIW